MKKITSIIAVILLVAASQQLLAFTTGDGGGKGGPDCQDERVHESSVDECIVTMDCTSDEGADYTCCAVTRLAMNWKRCRSTGHETGSKCGRSNVKYYKLQGRTCDTKSHGCKLTSIQQDATFENDDWELIACEDD